MYDITLKKTFLEFIPIELSKERTTCSRRTLSCPCRLDTETYSETDTSCTSGPEVPSSWSTDSGISENLPRPTSKGAKHKVVSRVSNGPPREFKKPKEPKQPKQPKEPKALQGKTTAYAQKRKSKTALAMRIKFNQELIKASCQDDLFSLVKSHLHQMNAVNLSTTMHRIARLGGPQDEYQRHLLTALLVVIENETKREIKGHGGSMPATSASIIAWSCASLQVFQTDLFAALIEVAQIGLQSCQDFEVTNVLWACAQLIKHAEMSNASLSLAVVQQLVLLLDAVEAFFQGRLQQVECPILVSALVSIARLSSLQHRPRLFQSICDAIAVKQLSLNDKIQLGVVGKIMSKQAEQNKEVLHAVMSSFAEKCPDLAFFLGSSL